MSDSLEQQQQWLAGVIQRSQSAASDFQRTMNELMNSVTGSTETVTVTVDGGGRIASTKVDDMWLSLAKAPHLEEALNAKLSLALLSTATPAQNYHPEVVDLLRGGMTVPEVVSGLQQSAAQNHEVAALTTVEAPDLTVRLQQGQFYDVLVNEHWFATANAGEIEQTVTTRVNAALDKAETPKNGAS